MDVLVGKKAVIIYFMVIWVLVVRCLSGCMAQKDALDKVEDISFTVVGEADVPEELKNLIDEKKQQNFKLTYSTDKDLYIAVGYGEQQMGGYSIAVKELYKTENAVVVDTELTGPESGEGKSGTGNKSYPYIVIKTEYTEMPMIFK